MFGLEISFADDPANVEYLLVRRPRFSLGSSKSAHVAIDEMASLGFDLEFSRNFSSSFSCRPVRTTSDDKPPPPAFLTNTYNETATIDLGPLSVRITSLETDLVSKESDPPDKAAVRIFRQSMAFESPQFPAWVMIDEHPVVVSFSAEQNLVVGRSNKCIMRVDAADVSNEHARIGYESGNFWVEDLGSTNGTYVAEQQLSGRQAVPPGTPIRFGSQTTIVGVISRDQLARALKAQEGQLKTEAVASVKRSFPSVISTSDLVRPARFTLQAGSTIVLGRDPDSDIWIGAPHISRKHCSISVSKTGAVAITDLSRNGVAWAQGILPRNQPFIIEAGGNVFDLGGGVSIAICFSEGDEESYRNGKIDNRPIETERSPDRQYKQNNSEIAPATPGFVLGQDDSISGGARDSTFGGSEPLNGKPELRGRLGLVLLILSAAIIGVVVISLVIHGFR